MSDHLTAVKMLTLKMIFKVSTNTNTNTNRNTNRNQNKLLKYIVGKQEKRGRQGLWDLVS